MRVNNQRCRPSCAREVGSGSNMSSTYKTYLNWRSISFRTIVSQFAFSRALVSALSALGWAPCHFLLGVSSRLTTARLICTILPFRPRRPEGISVASGIPGRWCTLILKSTLPVLITFVCFILVVGLLARLQKFRWPLQHATTQQTHGHFCAAQEDKEGG